MQVVNKEIYAVARVGVTERNHKENPKHAI